MTEKEKKPSEAEKPKKPSLDSLKPQRAGVGKYISSSIL